MIRITTTISSRVKPAAEEERRREVGSVVKRLKRRGGDQSGGEPTCQWLKTIPPGARPGGKVKSTQENSDYGAGTGVGVPPVPAGVDSGSIGAIEE